MSFSLENFGIYGWPLVSINNAAWIKFWIKFLLITLVWRWRKHGYKSNLLLLFIVLYNLSINIFYGNCRNASSRLILWYRVSASMVTWWSKRCSQYTFSTFSFIFVNDFSHVISINFLLYLIGHNIIKLLILLSQNCLDIPFILVLFFCFTVLLILIFENIIFFEIQNSSSFLRFYGDSINFFQIGKINELLLILNLILVYFVNTLDKFFKPGFFFFFWNFFDCLFNLRNQNFMFNILGFINHSFPDILNRLSIPFSLRLIS